MNDASGASEFNQKVIAEFRSNGGKVGGRFEDATLVLLHTTGAKTGAPRVNPVDCTIIDGGIVVYASASGTPKSPAWYYNLVANPEVRVELGTETFDAVARVTAGTERAALLEQQEDHMRAFAGDDATPREFHLVVITRTS